LRSDFIEQTTNFLLQILKLFLIKIIYFPNFSHRIFALLRLLAEPNVLVSMHLPLFWVIPIKICVIYIYKKYFAHLLLLFLLSNFRIWWLKFLWWISLLRIWWLRCYCHLRIGRKLSTAASRMPILLMAMWRSTKVRFPIFSSSIVTTVAAA